MSIQTLIDEIETDVADVIRTNFDYINTKFVPNRSDNQLTFERNIAKRGKILQSCVLYVDIRNSVDLTQKHNIQTMGRIYTAFSKAVLKTAKHHSGHIRNIIGDRVMVVFPSENCFTNAVDCAITINHVTQRLINKLFKDVDFKCGIGIDYGDLRVIKVGVQRRGHEGTENRSLVWVGYPANIASRLTDMANKSVTNTYFSVQRNPINYSSIFRPNRFGTQNRLGSYNSPLSIFSSDYESKQPFYSDNIESVEMSPEEFANSIAQRSDGVLFTTGGKLIKFEKKTRQVKYPSILITESVLKGLKLATPNRNSIHKNLWVEQTHQIKNVKEKVFGSDLFWII